MKAFLNFFVFLILFNWQNTLAQNCSGYPEFPEVNHLYIDTDYSICNRKHTIQKTLTFRFPEYFKITYEYPPAPAPPHAIVWRLEAELGDGNGQIIVGDDMQHTTTYPGSGNKTIKVFWCTTNQSGGTDCTPYQTLSFTILDAPGVYESPDVILEITTDKTFEPPCLTAYESGSEYLTNTIGKANAYIRYAPGHTQLVKPLIFVDGIDFSTKKFIDPNHGSGSGAVVRYGAQGWDVITMGSSESIINTADGDYSEFQYYPTAFENIQANGYDIIFLDFERGADYIQKNGRLLIALIEKVNILKVPDPLTGIKHENIVVGASMGGQVARWALTTMEAEEKPHCTHTYLSFDSPQKGANIPLSIQAFAWFADKTGLNEELWPKLNFPASSQLLAVNFGDAHFDGRLSTIAWGHESPPSYLPNEGINYGCLRESYAQEIEALGYPAQTRNIAISCGSEIGVSQGYSGNDNLFDAEFWLGSQALPTGNVFNVALWANSGNDSHMSAYNFKPSCIPEHHQSYTQHTIFGASFPRNTLNCFFGADVPYKYHGIKVINDGVVTIPEYDNAPGCHRSDLLTLRDEIAIGLSQQAAAIAESTTYNLIFDISIGLPTFHFADVFPGKTNTCYMPTMSALDIDWEMNTVNMWKNIELSDILNNNLTPFAAYYAPDVNLKHVELTEEMTTWVNTQLPIAEVSMSSTLPNQALGSTYNFGNDLRTRIPKVTINNGGFLRVNDDIATGYGNEPITNKELFEASTSGCSTGITVEQGGYFILGNDNGSGGTRRANVHVTRGSTVHIKSGGTLRLARGSKLIIESGGILEIDANAKLDLWWAESNIHIKAGGELRINGNFNLGDGDGYFQFDPDNILSFGPSVTVLNLQGEGLTKRLLQINDNATLNFGNVDLNLSYAQVQYQGGAGIVMQNSRADLFGVTFDGPGSFSIDNPDAVNVRFCDFNENADAMYITNFFAASSSHKLDFWQCDFNSCSNALLFSNATAVNITGCNFDGSQIQGPNGAIAIHARNMVHINFYNSYITNYPKFSTVRPVEIWNVHLFKMLGGRISDVYTGIWAPCNQLDALDINTSNVFMHSGAIIENCTEGIFIEKGGMLNSMENHGMVSMRCSKLINNQTGIKGVDVLLDISGCAMNTVCMPNSFIRGDAINYYFDIAYVDRPIPAAAVGSADNNFWSVAPNTNLGGGNSGFENYKLYQQPTFNNCLSGGFKNKFAINTLPELAAPPINCTNTPPNPEPYPDVKLAMFTGTIYECTIPMDGQYRMDQHYTLAHWEFITNSNSDGHARFQAIAATPNAVRNAASANCQHSIDVARVMAQGTAPTFASGNNDDQYTPEKESDNALQVYPNPASESVQVFFGHPNFTVYVYDLLGKQYLSTTMTDGATISVANWPYGLYLITAIAEGNNERSTIKLVVN